MAHSGDWLPNPFHPEALQACTNCSVGEMDGHRGLRVRPMHEQGGAAQRPRGDRFYLWNGPYDATPEASSTQGVARECQSRASWDPRSSTRESLWDSTAVHHLRTPREASFDARALEQEMVDSGPGARSHSVPHVARDPRAVRVKAQRFTAREETMTLSGHSHNARREPSAWGAQSEISRTTPSETRQGEVASGRSPPQALHDTSVCRAQTERSRANFSDPTCGPPSGPSHPASHDRAPTCWGAQTEVSRAHLTDSPCLGLGRSGDNIAAMGRSHATHPACHDASTGRVKPSDPPFSARSGSDAGGYRSWGGAPPTHLNSSFLAEMQGHTARMSPRTVPFADNSCSRVVVAQSPRTGSHHHGGMAANGRPERDYHDVPFRSETELGTWDLCGFR